jgi:predicted RNA binding protein with dsRBD fold (UPF0201 family)
MIRNTRYWLAWAMFVAACATSARGEDGSALRAYPDVMPADVSFDAVVKSQPFPFMKYVVNIIGAKVHPEEFHVTSAGEIIAPHTADWKGLCVAALVGSRRSESESGAGPITLTLPPADGVTSRLVDSYLPAVENQWTVGDLQVRQLAFATCCGNFYSATGREPLVAMIRYTATNKSSSPREVELVVQFGEAYGNMSVKTIPPAYPRKLSFAPPFFRREDGACVACLLTNDKKASFTFKPSGGSKPAADENRLSVKQTLAPGESRSVDLAVPYFALPKEAGRQLETLRIDDELDKFRKFWGRELNRNAEFIVPEGRIRDAYRACVASNFILIDRDPTTGLLMPHPDALGYEAVWAGDGSVSIQATDRMGYHKDAESMLDYFLARQGKEKPDGDVQSAEGFFSGDVDLKWMNQDGFVLWAMAEHYKFTHDETWLRHVAPRLIKGCDWIIRERARTKVMENGKKVKHYGLLPKGRPSDLYIWDNWYWTDTYSYMGLRGTADVLAAIGMKDQATRLAAEADDYKACILASVERSVDRKLKPPFVAPSPYRLGPPSADFFNTNWYSICSPIYMVEAGLLAAQDEKVADLEYWLEKYGLFSGLPAFMANSIDPYYVYNQSLSQLLRGEHSKFVWTLYSLSAYAMGQGTYATIEGQNIMTGFNGEAWSASRQPHMHSNSRFIDLVRIALVLEEGRTLHLMAGTPRGWLADGQKIEVKRAPSYFGEVNFTAHSHLAEGKIAVSIEPPGWQAANVVLHVRPPSKYGKIKAVSVNGQPWKDYDGESVRLPRLNKKTEVICAF